MKVGLINTIAGYMLGLFTAIILVLVYLVVTLSDSNKWLNAQNKAFFFFMGRMEARKMDYKACSSLVFRLTREYYEETKKIKSNNK